MALFQQSVVKKHIESLDKTRIEQKWQQFRSIFHNVEKQTNIRNSKEEQYQEGFLRDLFVDVLGYVINPEVNFNLLTELKNTNNSRKADGAIIVDGKAIAVIELKGTETTDLNKIEIQAFGYKSNQAGCNYVITSNFEKLRFYIDNTTQQEEFNLFTLTKERFEFLYVCLAWESISNNVPTNLLNQSVSKESAITKQLYNDYSAFKRGLFDNLVELNPLHDKLELFKKTQKLLDRFLFIFFAEDRLLLPTNLIRRINKEWENLQKMRMAVSLYDRYVVYFHDLNSGAKVTLPAFGSKTGEAIEETHEIFAYNGGLFKPDEFLDNLKINDQLLFSYTHKLSDYDFQSEVDVNILGHIFENSLNEIDEIKSEIEGNTIDKSKTRRKKDGVFYTPKYITKYIVDNTIGKLCTEKKEEIKLLDEDYTSTSSSYQKKTKKALLDKLADYRNWLLDLTICDPACGSGAFLNQALEFLIAEHSYVDELQAKLMGDAMILSDIENSILERNIYGVDLNDESVEIAKLSLWLRTAQKGRKLNSLNDNIKCGNSLIDDVEVAGDKAFSWEKEFPDVFAKGGFDVIIGNPPYGAIFNELQKNYYISKYKLSPAILDTYLMFLLKNNLLSKSNGISGYIIPSTWLYMSQFQTFRMDVINSYKIPEIILYRNPIFEDATVETCTTFLINDLPNKDSIYNFKEINNNKIILNEEVKQQLILSNANSSLLLKEQKNEKIFLKISNSNKLLKDYTKIVCGLTPYRLGKGKPKQTTEIVNNRSFDSDYKKDETYRMYLMGRDFNRYLWQNEKERWLSYGDWLAEPRYAAPFEDSIKLVIRQTSDRLIVHLDDLKYLSLKNVHNLKITDESIDYKYLICILNSKLMDWWYQKLIPEKGRVFAEVKVVNLNKLPIKKTKNQNQFIEKANQILKLNIDFQKINQKFSSYFSKQYQIEKLTGKLEKWYELDFADFTKELNKAIKILKGTPLTKKDEFEWIDLFEENKQKALSLKAEIDKTDKEIDQMVYALYELTEEEIKIVENV